MFRNRIIRKAAAAVLLLILCIAFAAAQAETVSFAGLSDALKYLKKNQPEALTIEAGKFKPSELIKVKNTLPEGAEFHFTVNWSNVPYSDGTEELDLRELKGAVKKEDLEALVALCPNLRLVDNSAKRYPTNSEMIELIEKYPQVHFDWIVSFGKGHYCATNATTFSTMNPPSSGKELTSAKLELLKYIPNLKALDLGHNDVTTLDFLKYVPDLELLIIADNEVTDITPIGQLKHLKYAELFKNSFSDLSALANCTELLDLNITWCPVTDLSPLDDIQTLERFWANMMRKLPEEQIGRFREKHPNTESYFYPSHAATVDGWRDHPRYKHYIWCFKNHQWIPFDEPLPTKK